MTFPNLRSSLCNSNKFVGLIPAAGRANRLGLLPCSKEILPVGFYPKTGGRRGRVRVACTYLMESMSIAGVRKAYVVTRRGKLDVAEYLGSGEAHGLHLAYVVADDFTSGVPFTLDNAYPFVQDSFVVFGFPDIVFWPNDAFLRLIERQAYSKAEMVLGLFPATDPGKTDMVEVGQNGQVMGISIKPSETHLRYTWLIGVWTPSFTGFMHNFVKRCQVNQNDQKSLAELFLGDVINAAIFNGKSVEKVVFEDGDFLDIGTEEDMAKACPSVFLRNPWSLD